MKKIISFVIFVVIVLIVFFLNTIHNQVENNEQKSVYNTINKAISKEIKYKLDESLSLAIALSKNQTIKDAIIKDNDDIAYEVLKENTTSLAKYLHKSTIYTQIVTKDFVVFTRSWDKMSCGMFLEEYREDLHTILQTKEPKVSIEVGRLLSIKASAPIFDYGGEFLATFEVITLLDEVVTNLREYAIELIPIMDKKSLSTAYLMEQNKQVRDKYVIVNKNYNQQSLEYINNMSDKDFNTLSNNDYFKNDDYFMLSLDMQNAKGNSIGKYIALIDINTYQKFKSANNTILDSIISLNTTSEDIYNYIKNQNNNLFDEIKQNDISSLHQIIEQKDIEEYTQEAKNRLKRLSKSELIEIIIKNNLNKDIRGEIK